MSFRQIFSSVFSSKKKPAPPLSGDITDRDQICSLFETARDHDETVNVRIFGHRGTYSTSILDVNKEKGYLILDAFNDPNAHEALLQRKRFLAGVDIDSVPLKFEANLVAAGVQDEIPFYRVKLPPKARYLQRRAYQRIDLLDQDTRFSGEHSTDNLPLNGFLKDISEQGVTLVLDQPVVLLRRETLHNCIIEIPGMRPIKCDLQVRHAYIDEERGVTLLGVNYHKADRRALRRIRKAVSQLYAAQQAADETAQPETMTAAPDTRQPSAEQHDVPAEIIADEKTQPASSSTPGPDEEMPTAKTGGNANDAELGWHFKTVVALAKQETPPGTDEDRQALDELKIEAR